MKLGSIGLGNMATAMLGGIIKAGLFTPGDITGSDASEAQRDKAAGSLKIGECEDNIDAIKGSDYVILAVKPQVYETVLKQIKGVLSDDQVVISIAPGKTLSYLSDMESALMQKVSPLPLQDRIRNRIFSYRQD